MAFVRDKERPKEVEETWGNHCYTPSREIFIASDMNDSMHWHTCNLHVCVCMQVCENARFSFCQGFTEDSPQTAGPCLRWSLLDAKHINMNNLGFRVIAHASANNSTFTRFNVKYDEIWWNMYTFNLCLCNQWVNACLNAARSKVKMRGCASQPDTSLEHPNNKHDCYITYPILVTVKNPHNPWWHYRPAGYKFPFCLDSFSKGRSCLRQTNAHHC